MSLSRQWRGGCAVIGLWLIAATFFIPVWTRGQVFGTFDLGHLSVPLEDIFARYQHKGQLPLWTPEFQGGYPLLANGLHSFFYPPHLILRQFFSGILVLNISLLLHLWLAAVGMWLLLKKGKLNNGAAWCGAMVWIAGGYFVGRITLSHLFLPAAWLPLVLWSWWNAWQRPTWRAWVLAAVVSTLQLLAGHPQIMVYTLFSLAMLLSVLWLHSSRGEVGQRWRQIGLTGIFVGLLSAVHLLPIQELVPLSPRAAPLVGQEAFDVSYPVRQGMAWIVPTVFGHGGQYRGAKNEPELMLYGGIGVTFLLLLGLLAGRLWRCALGQLGVGLVLMGALLAGGEYSVVYRWIWMLVPPLQHLANPGRAVVLIGVGAAIIAAYGWQEVWFQRRRWWAVLGAGGITGLLVVLVWQAAPGAVPAYLVARGWIWSTALLGLGVARWQPRWGQLLLGGALIAELIVAGLGVNVTLPYRAWNQPPRIAGLVAPGQYGRVFSTTRLAPIPDFVPAVGMHIRRSETVQQTFVAERERIEALRVGLTWNGQPPKAGTVKIEIVQDDLPVRESIIDGESIGKEEWSVFPLTPLMTAQGQRLLVRLSSTYSAAAPRVVLMTNGGGTDFEPTGKAEYCRKGSCAFIPTDNDLAFADLSFQAQYQQELVYTSRELLLPTLGEGLGYEMVRGHLTLQLQRMRKYMYILGERNDLDTSRLRQHRDLLDRLGVGVLLGLFPPHRQMEEGGGIKLLGKVPVGEEDIHVYQNERAYPRWQLAQRVIAVPDKEAAFQLLQGDRLARGAVVAEGVSLLPGTGEDRQARLQQTADHPTRMSFSLQSSSPQFLVVRETHFPGWEAFINGQPMPIYPTDGIFRGVVVPAGNHVIQFTYQPRAFFRGAVISGLAWMGALGALGWSVMSGKRKT